MEIDLINDMAFFVYAVIFDLPKEQAAVCFSIVYHSFSVRRWVATGLCTAHTEEYQQLIDDVRFAYVDYVSVEPEPRDLISFLPDHLELVRKTRIKTMFHPSSLCLDHRKLDLPEVRIGSSASVDDGPVFSETVKPVQNYLLSSNPQCIFSMTLLLLVNVWRCLELLMELLFNLDLIL